jgi:hypothetical protein
MAVASAAGAGREGLFPLTQRWFWIGLVARLGVLLVLGHWYDMFVFREISARLASGDGVYAIGPLWLAEQGEGYYVYPPLYAYALALAGLAARALGSGWYLHHLAIKLFLVAGDLTTFTVLRSIDPGAARKYWTLWFVPLLAIAQIQPDIWVGLSLLLAYLSARRGSWGLAGALVGLGAAIKFTPAVTIPFVVVYLWHRGARRRAAAFTVYAVAAFIATWLPYVALYKDAWAFGQVLAFHQARLGGGLSLITPVTVLLNVNNQLGGTLVSPQLLYALLQTMSRYYTFVTAGVLLAVLVGAIRGRWALERTFWLPMVAFLASTKLVNEQYLLQVLPLTLVVAPAFVPAILWPFSLYVIAAGTPLRFLPREINPVDFTNPSWAPHVLERPLMVLTVLMGGAALLFTVRLGRVVLQGATARPRPLVPVLRHVPLALAVLAVILLLVAQWPRARAIDLSVSPEVQDVTGTGAVSLIRAHARNRTADPLMLRFTVGFQESETVWVSANGSDTVSLPGHAEQIVLLQPRQFDRAIPLGVPFRVRAVDPEKDLAAEVSMAAPARVRWLTLWRIPGTPRGDRSSGSISLSRGVQERAAIGVRCVEGWMALRMTVRRDPASPSEWTLAEVQHRLDPAVVQQLIANGLEIWIFRPLGYAHLEGWPTLGQSVELRGPEGALLTFAFSPTSDMLFDLSPTRRVVVMRAAGQGWSRLHLRIAEDARKVGLRSSNPWTLVFSTAAQRLKPGSYEGHFGLIDPTGRPVPCGMLEGVR